MGSLSQKLMILFLGLGIGALVAIPVSSAQVTFPGEKAIGNVYSNSARVGAKVSFVSAGYVQVEHEPLVIEDISSIGEEPVTVSRQAYVSVRGLPGETAVLTCNVESNNRVTHNTRDCGGGSEVLAHAIMSGERLDNGIMLTRDLLPNPNGESASSISIEVAYI